MMWNHPVCLLISLLGAVVCSVHQNGRRGAGFALRTALPVLLLTFLVNPLFSHAGRTVLFYLPSGNPVTLESTMFGLASGVMLASVLLWFSVYNAVMTSDRFTALFGRAIPSLSLLLSMTLRFVPRFKVQLAAVTEAQRCIGRDVSAGRMRDRLRTAAKILSVMLGWALENAADTADSMKSRGYGLPGRSRYERFTLDGRDRALLLWFGFCGLFLLCGGVAGAFDWQYLPTLTVLRLPDSFGSLPGGFVLSFYPVYLALCLTPVILDRREARTWNSLRSAI